MEVFIMSEQLKLSNGQVYDLVTDGVQQSGDNLILKFQPAFKTFAGIENDFEDESKTEKIYVLDSSGETMMSLVGYTQYKGMEKIVDYVISSELVDGETKDVTAVVYKVNLSKPDIQKKVQDIQDTVDMLVADQLGV